MKFIASLTLCSLFFIVEGSPVTFTQGDLPIVPMTYRGPITPGGENVTLIGDAKSVYEQILNLNPHFNPDHFENLRAAKEQRANSKRDRTGITCDISTPGYTGFATVGVVDEGVGYLESLPGCCGVGSHQSARVSCSWNAAIFIVDNASYDLCPACWYIGEMARDVTNACSVNQPDVNGQESESAGWVTIVASSNC